MKSNANVDSFAIKKKEQDLATLEKQYKNDHSKLLQE
jgi:hypothetical protein